MASLLRSWLNDDITLSSHVSSFETAFKNGYLFGEILHRFNQQKNFRDFVNTPSADSKVRNFVLLEPTLRRLGIPISPRTAFDVMSAKKGAAMNLLYKLKVVIDKLRGLPRVGQRVVGGVEPLTNLSEKVSRPSFDKKSSELFEYAIRNLVENENNVMMERHVEKYTQRQTVLLQKAAEAQVAERTAELQRIDNIRQSAKEKLITRQMQANATNNDEIWRNNLKNRSADMKRTAAFQARTQNKASARRTAKLDNIRQQTMDDLDRFDNRLSSMDAASSDVATLEVSSTQPAVEDSRSFEDRLAAQVAPTSDQRNEASQFLDSLSQTRSKVDAERKERERRRRQYLTRAAQARAAAVAASAEDEALSKAVRATAVENQIAHDHDTIRAYKDAMIENRQFRSELYNERKERDIGLNVAREETALEAHVGAHELDLYRLSLQCMDRDVWEKSKQHSETTRFCGRLLDGVIDVVMQVAQYRHLEFGDYRPKPSAHAGLALPGAVEREILLAFHLQQAKQRQLDGREFASEVSAAEFNDYLSNSGRWAKQVAQETLETEAVDANDEPSQDDANDGDVESKAENDTEDGAAEVPPSLAEIVQSVSAIARPPAPQQSLSECVSFPLQVCLLGKRCSGKTGQAKLLSEKFNVEVIVFDDLVANAAAAESGGDNDDLYRSVRGSLESGADVSDADSVALIANALRQVDQEKQGWVLDGWPETLAQAQLLHKELVNFSLEEEAQQAPEVTGSKLYPPPLPVERDARPALFDAVFRLEIDHENLLRRAIGAREDSINPGRATYHLDQSIWPRAGPPVPIGDTSNANVVLRLRTPPHLVPEVQAAADLSKLADWRSDEIQWWYQKFDNFVSVGTDGLTREEIFSQFIAPKCQSVVDTKAAADQAAANAAAAEQKRQAHEQLLRDFALIHGEFEAEREAEKTEEELAEIAALEAAASKKKKAAKLPPPRMETLFLTITPEGDAILPESQAEQSGDAGITAAETEAKTNEVDDSAQEQQPDGEAAQTDGNLESNVEEAAAEPQTQRRGVKLARFGRDVLVLPDKTRLTLAFEEVEEGSDPEEPPKVTTVTRDSDGLVFKRVVKEDVVVEEPPPPRDPNTVATVGEVVESLPSESASLLHEEFAAMEDQFTSALRASFERLSSAQSDAVTHLQQSRANFVRYLGRGEGAQQRIVDEALQALNAVPDDIRFDSDVKAELHQRVADMTAALVKQVEQRQEQNSADIEANKANGYIAHQLQVVQAHLCALVQAEVTRAFGTRQYAADLYALRSFKVLPDTGSDSADADATTSGLSPVNVLPQLVDPSSDAPAKGKKAPKKGKKGAKEVAEGELPPPSPQLDECVSAAEQALTELATNLLVPHLSDIAKANGMSDEDVASALESKVLKDELEKGLQRVRQIKQVGAQLCADLRAHALGVITQLEKYSNERLAHEFAVIQTISDHLHTLVEEERTVEFELRIEHSRPDEPALRREGQNGLTRLVEDRTVRLQPHPAPPPVRSVQSTHPNTCSRHQLLQLARALREAAASSHPLEGTKPVSVLSLETVSRVIQQQIARGLAPSSWVCDDPSAPRSLWEAALLPFAVPSQSAGNVTRAGLAVDWRSVMTSAWESTLHAEHQRGELGLCTNDSDLRHRVHKLRTALRAFREHHNNTLSGPTLAEVPRTELWFARGEQDAGSPEAQLEADARHQTMLEILVEIWGSGGPLHSSETTFDFVSFLGYVAGVGGPKRSAAVIATVAAFAKASAEDHGHTRVDASSVHLTNSNVKTVFPDSRGYSSEASSVTAAMRDSAVSKLTAREVLHATARSNSNVVPVLQPCLKAEATVEVAADDTEGGENVIEEDLVPEADAN
mgnify:FL=1